MASRRPTAKKMYESMMSSPDAVDSDEEEEASVNGHQPLPSIPQPKPLPKAQPLKKASESALKAFQENIRKNNPAGKSSFISDGDSDDEDNDEEDDARNGDRFLEEDEEMPCPPASSSHPHPSSSHRRSNRSPMSTRKDEFSDSSSDEDDFPMKSIRKSLKDDFEMVDLSQPTTSSASNQAAEEQPVASSSKVNENEEELSTLEKTALEPDEDNVPVAMRNDALCMGPNETRKVMAGVKDNWETQKKFLYEKYEKEFPQWHLALRMRMNILVYGVGSKKVLLERFREKELLREPTLVVDGFHPKYDLKMNISSLCEQMTGERAPKDEKELIAKFAELIKDWEHFNIIIHSIDGPRFRTTASQNLLSEISKISNVHLVVSVDHPNLSLLWNQKQLECFKWLYFHMSTFEKYTEYPIPELTLKAEKGHSMKLASLRQVFAGLTQNAKQIFEEIAKYQIKDENAPQSTESGMPYSELYRVCRAEFLVSSDVALRKQLVEYLDHELLESRRTTSGQELLVIPIDSASLKAFLDNPDA